MSNIYFTTNCLINIVFIRTPPFLDALHRVGAREPCCFTITIPPFLDALHRVGAREPCCFTIKKLIFTIL